MNDDYKKTNEKFIVKKDSVYAKKFTSTKQTTNENRNYNSNQYGTKNFNGYRRPYVQRKQGYSGYSHQSDRNYDTQGNRSYGQSIREERSTEPSSRLEKELFDGDEVEKGINFDMYDDIPVEVSGRDVPTCIENFDEVDNIHPQLLWNIDRSGYTKPTPIQKYSFAISVTGRDIMAVAQTGSGKTAAFLFPMIQMLMETGGSEVSTSQREITPIAIILTPTRELASQIQAQARKFLYRTGMRSCVVYGGISIGYQRSQLRGGADILVATPGRLTDFMQRGEINMSRVRFVVLDEADRMLDMGFEDQIRTILSAEFGMPPAGKRQTMMFSATFPREIQLLAQKFMGEYVFVAVGKVGGAAESVVQEFVYSISEEKPAVLLDFFESIEDASVLIFAQRKIFADQIERFLRSNNIRAMSIHGDKSQRDREFAISCFKRGECKVLVATDVASRGLDIPNVAYVVNFDMTTHIGDYVHRIGRTGRIGNKGVALTIISEIDNAKILEDLRSLLADSKQKVPNWLDDLIARRRNDNKGTYSGYRGKRGGGFRGGSSGRRWRS